MKTKMNRITAAVAAFGFAAMPALSGVAHAKGHNDHHDNGKHLGWDKGKGNKHNDNDWDDRDRDHDRNRDYDRDRDRDHRTWHPTTKNSWEPTATHRSTVHQQWTKSRPSSTRSTYTNTNSNWRLNNTRPFDTKASAERAAALRRQQGYRTSVTYDPNRHVYLLHEYHNSATNRYNTRRTTPVSSSHLVGTHYYSTQASAAAGMRFAQSKGYRATSTYDRANNRWIVRTYTR
jgi:hypothetical protein